MSRFSSLLAVAVALAIMAPASAALAEKVYTVNTKPLPLLSRPSEKANVITMLPPSSTVERARDHSYTLVIYQTPDGKEETGWIQSKFVSAVPSESSRVQELTAENEALKAQLAQLQNNSSGLSQKEKDLTDKLSALNTAYVDLKNGSANYLKLKTEYNAAKTGLDRAGETIRMLTRQNDDLKLYHKIQWFLAGGLVLLLGWFIGWGSTKLRRKRRQSYYL